MDKQVLPAEERKVFGRKVKTLRDTGLLPANVYGKKIKSQALQVDGSEFLKVFKKAGETGLVELVFKKGSAAAKSTVLIHNVQVNPVTDEPIHADFFQVDLKEKVTADVPVELFGESPAEKAGKGTVVQQLDEIEVTALPTDLPDKFSVDISGLSEVDDAILVSDLKVDKEKVEIEENLEQIIVKVEPAKEEVEEVVAEAPAEEGAKEEGEEAEKATEGEEQKVQKVEPEQEKGE